MPTYEATKRGYLNLWNKCELDKPRIPEIDKQLDVIGANVEKYKSVEAETGVPWFWIACTHYRESSLDFRSVLHNGEKIIGTGKKTSLVPAGRGPFYSWEEAAIDAVTSPPHKLDKIDDWPVARCLYEFERYNGWGYMGRENSPYVWAGTTMSDETGKYVRDHVYDQNAVEKQLGCAALLKRMTEVNDEVADRLDGNVTIPQPDPVIPLSLADVPRLDLIRELTRRPEVANVLVSYAEPPA